MPAGRQITGPYFFSFVDFRAVEVQANMTGMDVLVGTVQGPPYPTEALQVEMSSKHDGHALRFSTGWRTVVHYAIQVGALTR